MATGPVGFNFPHLARSPKTTIYAARTFAKEEENKTGSG